MLKSWRQVGWVSLGVPAARGVYLLFVMSLARVYGASGLADAAFFVAGMLALVTSALSGISDAVLIPALLRAEHEVEAAARLRFVQRRLWAGAVVLTAATVLFLHLRWPGMPAWLYALAALPLMAVSTAIQVAQMVRHGRLLRSQAGHFVAGLVLIPCVYIGVPSPSRIVALLLGYEALRWLSTLGLSAAGSRPVDRVALPQEQQRQLWRAALGQLGSYMLSALPGLISLYLARGMDHGLVSMLEYLNRLWAAATLVFAGYLLYLMSRFKAVLQEDIDAAYVQRSVQRILVMSLIALPCAWGGCVFLAYFWFDPRVWSAPQLHLWIASSAIYFLALPAYLVGMIYVRWANMSMQTRVVFTAVLLNLVGYLGAIILLHGAGLKGLVLSFVVGQYVQCAVLYRLYRRRVDPARR